MLNVMFHSQPGLGCILSGNEKFRVAVGIFHDIAMLCDALDGLAAIDCVEVDLVLLCETRATADELVNSVAALSEGRISLLVRSGDDGQAILAGKTQSASKLSRDQILHFETWIESHLADHLDHHLKRGGYLLLCPVLSPVCEQSVSRVLLNHATDPVQLHDLRPGG